MAVSYLCVDCFSEGTTYGFAGLVAGPPVHCHGRNDKVMPGVIGGFRCICKCAREARGNGSRKWHDGPITNGSSQERA